MSEPLTSAASDAVRKGRGILAVAFLLSFFVNMLRLSGPLFMILIYDRVLPARSEETLVALFIMVVTFLVAQAVIDYARRRILARFGAQFQERVETALLASAGPGDLFEPGRTKPIIGLDEVDELRAFFHSTSLIAIYDFFWTPMFLIVVFILDPLLGWVCLGGAGLILALVVIRITFVGSREADANAASKGITDLRTLVAASRETLRSQGMGQGFKHRWLVARRVSRDRAISLKDWTTWFDSLSDATVLLTRYSVLGAGAWLTLNGSLTIGAMVAATFLVSRVLVPVEKFLTEVPAMIGARRNWVQLKRTLAALAADRTGVSEVEGNPRARLSVANLWVRSGLTGETILKGISLDLPPGEVVQIVGNSGKGKTLLAEAIRGLSRIANGTVLADGKALSQLSEREIDHFFGFVPENPGFVAGTLAENISRLATDQNPERVAAAARKAFLHAAISSLPDGYKTVIDAPGSLLSRSQRHQLALARALYDTPEVLIIDEPDILVDHIPKTFERTLASLTAKGTAILLLTRRRLSLSCISADYQLDDGRLKRLKDRRAQSAANVAVLAEASVKERPTADPGVTKLIRGT